MFGNHEGRFGLPHKKDLFRSNDFIDASPYPVGKIVHGVVIDRVAALRVLFTLSALTVISLESSRNGFSADTLKVILAFYAVYSILLCILMLRQNRIGALALNLSPWLDVGWFTLLFAFGIQTSSIFYFGFFFAIVGASFRQGFNAGIGITIGSCLLSLVVGYSMMPEGHEFGTSRFMLRPLFLLLVGYMVAHWGGSELKLKQRLLLLKEISTLSNPRFGVDRTVGYVMEKLRSFVDADSCLIVTRDQGDSTCVLRRTYPNNPERAGYQENISDELAKPLLSLTQKSATVFRAALPYWKFGWGIKCYEYDLVEHRRNGFDCKEINALGARLDASSFISLPLRQNYQIVGRIFLTSRRRSSTFTDSDIEFLYQVVEHVMPVLENIRLVDRMASDAAERERQRIAFDIHDTVVQPYIGLQMGLTAVRQKIQNDGIDVTDDIERLQELTTLGISHLRDYISGLKSNGHKTSSLETAVRRIAAKFSEGTGIDVQVVFEVESPIYVNDRLTAEVFQMVAEGLSNIRRHTQSTDARIAISCLDGILSLQIENDGGPELSAPFLPVSLTERTASLGGTICVKQVETDRTAVNIQIPL